MEKLTYKEEYEIPLEIIVDEYHCEYANCGSHKMKLNVILDLENVKKLLEQIKNIKGIN